MFALFLRLPDHRRYCGKPTASNAIKYQGLWDRPAIHELWVLFAMPRFYS